MCRRNLPDFVNFPKHVPSDSKVSRLTLVACRINLSLHGGRGQTSGPNEHSPSELLSFACA